jgi:putative hemolysin
MKIISIVLALAMPMAMLACSTPTSNFGVYQQSDGTIGVHAPKSAKDTEAQASEAEECKKIGNRSATFL